ncbi:hypothetical protein PYH37_002956 [Sinorhizobium numidicum]|uniref:Uncharacterized protein n=1 Tax=Sinorhizobium numidicum TaxID=680248 RepID=A0ABY8D6T9_9HYPH|nr:hypothetical protein [Sinorhizobium numidicum]WEX78104.1 hypothetical protein PYH37_002956 [Sinorhizobium numidicum]WEX84763.1 hypothetical protein PYH38_003669 [Sinorhizobium numidicum]
MEHVAAIMILVGCMQGAMACREVPSPVVGFETAKECQALLSPAVEEVGKVFKEAYGKCAPVDPALFVENVVIEWEVTSARELQVQIIPEEEAPYAIAERGLRPTPPTEPSTISPRRSGLGWAVSNP